MSEEHVTRAYIDSRFDRLGQQIAEVNHKSDRNHADTKAQFEELGNRVDALEARQAGHTDDEIIEMIDERLAVFARDVLPGIVKEAMNDGLRVPLTKLDDNTEALTKLETSIKPVVQFCETATNLRAGLLWIGGPVAVILSLLALAGYMGWLS